MVDGGEEFYFLKEFVVVVVVVVVVEERLWKMTTLVFFFVLFALNIFLGLPSSSSCWKVGSRKRKKIFCGQPFDTKETTWEIKKEPRVGGRNYNLCINQRAVETGIIDKCGLKKDIKTHLIVINNTHGPALDGLVGFIFFLFFL